MHKTFHKIWFRYYSNRDLVSEFGLETLLFPYKKHSKTMAPVSYRWQFTLETLVLVDTSRPTTTVPLLDHWSFIE